MRSLSSSSFFRIAQSTGEGLLVYHISNNRFDMFDPNEMAQGVTYFSRDKESLITEGHGADADSRNARYLYTCRVNVSKPAGYDEYDKYSIDELESLGYDYLDFSDAGDIAVFDTSNIEVLDVEEINPQG